MNKLMEYITNPLFIVLIVFIVLLLTFNILQKLGRGRVWKQIAAEMGLQFSRHRTATYRDQQLSGIYRKRPITLTESESEESRADQHRRSQEGNPTNVDTEIRINIIISKGIKMSLNRVIVIGGAAQVTGDEEIDRRFNITSEPDWFAKKVLDSSIIHQNLSQLKMGSSVFVQESELLFTHRGRISDGKYLRFLFDFLGDLAEAVEAAAIDVS
jgi:hypothetical protein